MATFIDPELVNLEFKYFPETGELLRDVSVWEQKDGMKGRKSEKPYLHRCKGGKTYLRIGFQGKRVYAHRIIWVLMTGDQPIHIDHVDGDGLNNRWENLRSVTCRENMANQKIHNHNTSGANGVSYRKDSGKWRARIMVNGNPISVGTFSTKEAAIQARNAANSEYGFHENHGKRQVA